MRTYVGERSNGRPRVWVVDRPEEVPISEISTFLSATRRFMEDRPGADEATLADHEVRKRDLIARIERAGETRRALVHRGTRGPDGFEWGYTGTGPSDLAHELLRQHLDLDVTTAVRTQFRDDVVARLDRERFELPASEINAWVVAHRDLVEEQMFFEPRPGFDQPAFAVTDALAIDVAATEPRPAGEATASTLVAACEAAWTDIRRHHPELPEAVMVLGTGVERGRLVKLGHWWGGQWVVDGQPRGEVLLAGEALHLPPHQVFEILLHEAAHGINAARGVKDTSRGGRYHNGRFASTAREVLLDVETMPPYGMAHTTLTPAAEDRYADTIGHLGEAMRIARHLDRKLRIGAEGEAGVEGGMVGAGPGGGAEAEEGGRSQATAAACGCGRRMRMAPSVLAAGPVVCGMCGSEFSAGAERRRPIEPERSSDAVVARSFVDRRSAALSGEGASMPVPVGEGDAGVDLDRLGRRIQAAVAIAILDNPEAFGPVLERAARLTGVAPGPGATPTGREATATQAAGGTDPRLVAGSPGDHEAVKDWYERFDTLTEEPMPANGRAEASRREGYARALLRADGTLRGPGIIVDQRELVVGDRVVNTVEDPERDLPAGVPGTVERVDPEAGRVEVEFATWGRLEVAVDDVVTRGLRHDYVELSSGHQAGCARPEIGRTDPGVEW